VENLGGSGNWFYIYGTEFSSTPLTIYPVGGTAPSATFPILAPTFYSKVTPSANVLGITGNDDSSISIVDLSGSTPVKTDLLTPVISPLAITANTATQWIVGNGEGVIFDGTSLASTPRYFGYGKALSIAGSSGYIAVATAIGTIPYFTPTSSTPLNTINGRSANLALSSSGAVLAALQGSFLNLYSLPSGSLNQTFSPPTNYSFTDVTLSADASTLGELFQSTNNPFPTFMRQVLPASGGAPIWTDNPPDGSYLPQLSFDGSIVAASSNSPNTTSSTQIFAGGQLTTAVAGQVIGWVDSTHFLAQPYIDTTPGRGLPSYTGTSNIFDKTGTLTSTVVIPQLSKLLPISSSSIYAPDLNNIFSLTIGSTLYTSPLISTGKGAIAGSEVVFATGSKVVIDNY
jgi:hypothetical protein